MGATAKSNLAVACLEEVSLINRNVSIVVALLVVMVIIGYLIWLRSKVSLPVSPKIEEQQAVVTPSPEPILTASPSAVPTDKKATGSAKPKAATSGATKR